MSKEVIVLLKGGIGNQLFQYAAALGLANRNRCLVYVDNINGFKYDNAYKREYCLNWLNITSVNANSLQRLEPFSRFRRKILKMMNSKIKICHRNYIFETKAGFDRQIYDLKIRNRIFLDGYWQSELYFNDIKQRIKKEYEAKYKICGGYERYLDVVDDNNAVAVHWRWFNKPGLISTHNLYDEYYTNAIQYIKSNISSPHYIIFTEYPEETERIAKNLFGTYKIVTNQLVKDIQEFELMRRCKNHIMANSTFSWWAAWLAEERGGAIVAPARKMEGLTTWNAYGQVPDRWIKV